MKYPHTPYLKSSPHADKKDVKRDGFFDLKNFLNTPLVITIKMDGSNLQMTRDKIAARNGVDATHSSFDLAKAVHSKIKNKIPEDIIIFGEWLYAIHSIHYKNDLALDNLFQMFAVYNKSFNVWESYRDLEEWANHLQVGMPICLGDYLFRSEKDLVFYATTIGERVIKQGHEGIVVRKYNAFKSEEFSSSVAKYVRKDHVQTNEHWKEQKLIRNEIKKW